MSQVIEKSESNIVEFSPFRKDLAEFKDRYDVVYDLTNPEQEKQAKSDKHAIGKVISRLDAKHKELKAPLKERTDLIDGERKSIKDELLVVQNKIKEQLNSHEQAIQEHAEDLQDKVDAIYRIGAFDEFEQPDLDQLKNRLVECGSLVVDDTFEDRKADGCLAQVETVKKLTGLVDALQKYEDDQAELEKLRKKQEEFKKAEREEMIRNEAAAEARLEAEKQIRLEQERAWEAEQETKRLELAAAAALKKAETDKQAAIELAATQERQRIEAEQKAKEEKEAAKRKQEEAKKSKQAHRKKKHAEAKQSLIEAGYEEKIATNIVELVRDNAIKNMSINY